ncbi:MAG TPA: ABC transporter substrate-binding protein [Thermomicrobiales bacterium]|nr:ABC transporter substrate-binding protein [Thermomicrobiales bacterium]
MGPRENDQTVLRHSLSRRSLLRSTTAVGVIPVLNRREQRVARAAQATPQAEDQIGQLTVIRDQEPAYAGEPIAGGDLRIPLHQAENENFNPVAFDQDFQIPVSYLDPLVKPNPLTLAPEPWLAESWEWNEDQTVITYSLRSGVTWHDGTPLTADDVRFSLFVARDDIFSEIRNFFVLMDDVEAVDDLTVRVILSAVDNTWLFNASSLLIFQRAQYTDYWSSRPYGERTLTGFDWEASPPLGTGPWIVEAFDGDGVTMTRNDAYWAGAPFMESLSLPAMPDPADRLAAWNEGEIDLLWPVPAIALDELSGTPARLHVVPSASVMFAAFNFDNPARIVPNLLAEPALRAALNLAIDRVGYAEDVFRGFIAADQAGTVAQPWANAETVTNPRRDVRKARQILADAGWQDFDGDGILDDVNGQRLELVTIVREDAPPELIETLQRVSEDLREIGATLNIQVLEPAAFMERWINAHDFDLIAYAYDLFPGFTDFDLYGSAWDIRVNPQGWNPGGYRNLDVDQAILERFETVDQDEQAAILEEIQRITNKDLFGLWFGFPYDLILVRESIQGFRPNVLWQTADTRLMWQAGER